MNFKQIATTFALLGSGAFALTACEKDKPASEVPGADGAGDAGEAACAAEDHPGEGHCGGDEAEASCGADLAEGDEGEDAPAEADEGL